MLNTPENARRRIAVIGVGGQELEINEPESGGRLSVVVYPETPETGETIEIPPAGHNFKTDRSTPEGRFWQDGIELSLSIPEGPEAHRVLVRGTDEFGLVPLYVRYSYNQDGGSRTLEIPYQSTRGSGWSDLVYPGDPGWHNGFVEQEGRVFGIFLPAGIPRLMESGKPV